MKKRVDQELVYAPQAGATIDELMQIMKLVMFQTYPLELRTQENLTILYNQLPDSAKRHFQVKDKE